MTEDNKVEVLADYAHKAWSGWMIYLFKKASENKDGSVTIPSDLVERWKRQSITEYKDLPEKEKDSDRVEAKEILSVLKLT